jgi:uncharacterized membrane-anchored protein
MKELFTRKNIYSALIAVVVLQLIVLAGVYLNSVYPLWIGQEIKLKMVPVDPRSTFRGNYARLNYEISRVRLNRDQIVLRPRYDQFVYVSLIEKDGVYVFDQATLSKPQEGMFIRGRIKQPRWSIGRDRLQVAYGIEAYFVSREKAKALEKDLRRGGGVAVVMVAPNGKATLKDVIATTE